MMLHTYTQLISALNIKFLRLVISLRKAFKSHYNNVKDQLGSHQDLVQLHPQPRISDVIINWIRTSDHIGESQVEFQT